MQKNIKLAQTLRYHVSTDALAIIASVLIMV